jgi:hypothetical protein
MSASQLDLPEPLLSRIRVVSVPSLTQELLFHLLSKLYERSSVVITTNLRFSEWATVFGPSRDIAAQCPVGQWIPG